MFFPEKCMPNHLKGKQFYITSFRSYTKCFGPRVSNCRAKTWCINSPKGRGWVLESGTMSVSPRVCT
jgi:hypothetical protein